jgi:hypothetical protein
MNKIWLIAIITVVSSCTEDVTIDMDNPESKIVVNSFFSPQGSLLVNISKSISILATDTLNYINDAEVELFQDGSSMGKLTSFQKGFYTIPAALLPKGEYSISVSAPGMGTVSSHDTIPVQIPILSLDTITFNNKYLFCEIQFQDIPNTANYYVLEITSKYPVLNSDKFLSTQIDIVVNDNIIENSSNDTQCKRVFFSDDKIPGAAYQLSFLLEKAPLLKSLKTGSNTLYINFKTISAAYYKYIKTYYEAQTKQMDVYTNITNGYGIFAGYNISQDSIVFQQ